MDRIKINGEIVEYDLDTKDNLYTVIQDESSETYQIFKYGKNYLLFDLSTDSFEVLDAYRAKDRTVVWVRDEKFIIEEEPEEGFEAAEEGVVENDIKSPMPGVIKEIKFKEGDSVKKGDTVVVLESMKVLNELKSSVDGTIKKIHVQEGAQVDLSELLVEIEPEEESDG